ncbi:MULTISPECIES: MFS transporter [unclassified Meiothermus]|uniref:MFS transporter n=1 Tax=unclassified Meiothermus TaxID=370471 RepID=UPI000D7BC72C|nr:MULTISPECIES: MFS transporter [unclassified Meiothermus]PZA06878.1 MFS transporter [Meiothermus sp. Pnk-1]RYM37115.1 MFS transporter [Meiothermus sp. PNK-Is4]
MRLRIARLLPWKTAGLLPLFSFVLLLGLIEAVRSGFFAVYLPNFSKSSLGFSPAVWGASWTAHFLAESLFKGPGGYLVQRLGLGVATLMAGAAGLLALLLLPHISAPWMLWGLTLLWGLSLSAVSPGLMTLSSRLARPGREGRALAYTTTLILPWAGVGFLLMAFLVPRDIGSAYTALWVGQSLVVLLSLPLLGFREKIALPKQEYYPWRQLVLFIPAAFGQTFAPAIVSQLIQKFATSELKLGFLELGAVILLGGAVAFSSMGWLGRIPDRRGPKAPLIVGLCLMSATMVLIAQKLAFFQLLAVAVLGGMGFALFVPSWNALVVRVLPQNNRAAIWGTLMMIEAWGTAAGPSVGGILWSTLGVTAPFYASAAAFLAVAVFYIFAIRRKV